ncbi:MAG TPA: DUF5681 domain-containing protein [Phycisphaerae bacterium]|nr:DUF5681 domain-containing protein [Phycisphaerae bacterium]
MEGATNDTEKQSRYRGLKPFKPGQSGNPGGRPKGRKSITAALRRLLDSGIDGKDLYEALAKAGLSKALKGDHKFWSEILERIDGKVPDRIADADGQPLVFNIVTRQDPCQK